MTREQELIEALEIGLGYAGLALNAEPEGKRDGIRADIAKIHEARAAIAAMPLTAPEVELIVKRVEAEIAAWLHGIGSCEANCFANAIESREYLSSAREGTSDAA